MDNHNAQRRTPLASFVIATALAMTLAAGFATPAGAQDDWQYGAETMETGDAYLGEEAAPYDPAIDQHRLAIASGDTDADGLQDSDELAMGLDPLNNDTDGDTLTDASEFIWGTSPWDRDTDGDGTGDGDEIINGTDPLNPPDVAPAVPFDDSAGQWAG